MGPGKVQNEGRETSGFELGQAYYAGTDMVQTLTTSENPEDLGLAGLNKAQSRRPLTNAEALKLSIIWSRAHVSTLTVVRKDMDELGLR